MYKKLKEPSPALLRRENSIMAITMVGLIAMVLLLLSPAGRRAQADIDHCAASGDVTALDMPLPHVARSLAQGGPLTIVAFGSSSTYGTGASAPDKTYPSRLAKLLASRFPSIEVNVLNRGVGGETAGTTLERIDTDVIAEHPDLVIWQVGTNDLLHDIDPADAAELIRTGTERMKSAGIDVVLMDLQFAPAILQHPRYREMERAIASAAHAEDVPVIHRFAMMREWAEEGRMPLSIMLAHDKLHMTDMSYDCLARQVGRSIVGAVKPRA